ncbi:MlaC/ttg2D family ABC transporter substrate-binding protein [Jhaorihella thermophila]|uniref:Phospholipid transport system substrate-binding protein n=1 Tax=Jhaorihella thermophila TaxID=488547 RepID=A0A1H5YAT8_9RHOB|nr:ABC transporter substrate-binding protein [Jhaorihella thermophila]SEG20720.1 phospholipid transport system substrate-binding protein [Jhaorihella thermophila]
MNDLNRRTVMTGIAAAALSTAALPRAAVAALTEARARQLIDQVVTDINRVIASGKPEEAMYADFERIFAKYADTAYIAAYALGADGRRATAAQKKAFSKAFQSYLARKYGKRFREFIGGRLEVQSVRKVKRWYEVKTIAYLRGQAPFEVTFLVSERTGKDKFFNMFVEGVNMLLTERTEIGAMLDARRGDIDAMIRDLRRAG